MVPGRIVARATVLCVLTAVVVVPAAAEGAPARSNVTVTRAVVAAHWKEGWLRPGAAVRLTGRVTAPTHVTAVLRPIGRKGVVTALADVDVARAGTFGASMPLPPRPLPGKYRLHVTASGRQASKPADVVVRIPAPREGVVGAATAGTSANGPWLRYESGAPTLSGPQRELWMRFPFLAPPSSKDVSIVWRLRWRVVVGTVHRAYDDTIETYARSATALPAGTWTVLLKVDGRVAKRMAVRLVGGPEPKSGSAAGITVG